MYSIRLRLVALTGICLLSLATFSQADDTIDIKDLPKAVMRTLTGRYPKAMLTEARKTVEDKTVVFEVELTNEKKLIAIALFADGKIDWVAVSLPVLELPKPVVGGIQKKYAGATLDDASTVYTVKDGKDELQHYSVELTTKDGKKRTLDVSPKGMIEEDVEINE